MRVRHDRNDYSFLFMNNNKQSFLQTRSHSFSLVSSCFLPITASLIVTMCQGLVSPLECSSKASEHPLHTLTPSRDLTWAAVVLSSICPTWFINISGKESLKFAVTLLQTVAYHHNRRPRCILGRRMSGVRVWNGCATAHKSFVRVWETQHVVINKYNRPVFISYWLYLDY